MKINYINKNCKVFIVIGSLILFTSVFNLGIYFGKSGRGWPFIKKTQIWSIGIYKSNKLSNLIPYSDNLNPVLTAKDVKDVQAEYVADPFMIENNSIWYMFFEVMNRKTDKGEIGLAVSGDCRHWEYQQIVLEASFHLSYPYVFKSQNEYYMIPETHSAYAIQLYKCTDFPLKWVLQKKIIYGAYSDPSIFLYNGKWWLFASEFPARGTLHLFYSDELEGPWVEHPKSAIVRNNLNSGRQGGRIILYEGHIICFRQDCQKIYGNKLRAFEITELTTENYKEHEILGSPILEGSGKGWNADGMHNLDFHFDEKKEGIACVDGWRMKISFNIKF